MMSKYGKCGKKCGISPQGTVCYQNVSTVGIHTMMGTFAHVALPVKGALGPSSTTTMTEVTKSILSDWYQQFFVVGRIFFCVGKIEKQHSGRVLVDCTCWRNSWLEAFFVKPLGIFVNYFGRYGKVRIIWIIRRMEFSSDFRSILSSIVKEGAKSVWERSQYSLNVPLITGVSRSIWGLINSIRY